MTNEAISINDDGEDTLHSIKGGLKCLLILIVSLAMNGCAVACYYDTRYGRVIDLSTREPIQGAAVLTIYSTSGLDHTEFIDAVEVLSDNKGRFTIPSQWAFTFRVLGSCNPNPLIFIYYPEYGCFPKYYKETIAKDSGDINIRVGQLTPNLTSKDSDYSWPAATPLLIALDKLTKEERRKYSDCYVSDVPYAKMREMRKLEFIERIDLGFGDYQDKVFLLQPDLYMAIVNDDYNFVRKLINNGSYSNLDDTSKLVFMKLAIKYGNKQIVEILKSNDK